VELLELIEVVDLALDYPIARIVHQEHARGR
jgi:hypothetical protein